MQRCPGPPTQIDRGQPKCVTQCRTAAIEAPDQITSVTQAIPVRGHQFSWSAKLKGPQPGLVGAALRTAPWGTGGDRGLVAFI
jgi:hypothetical protein